MRKIGIIMKFDVFKSLEHQIMNFAIENKMKRIYHSVNTQVFYRLIVKILWNLESGIIRL